MMHGLDTETQLKYQEAKLTGKKCNQTISLGSMQVYGDEDDYTNLTVKHNDNKGVYISNQLLSNQDVSVDSINMDDLKLKFYLPIPMYDASKNEKIESQIDPQIEEIITQIKERRIGDYLKGTVPVLINKACSFQYKQIRKTDNLTINESCIHCGLCAKECPEQAIEIKEHVTFKKEQCMMCLRCLHHCPVNAIRFKNKDKGQYRRLL